MGEIRKLPDHLVNLIAAGEVVERPASVVKELLENALDAQASSVEIELEAGGRKSIIIRDDGSGMTRHNLLLAIQRHATSKISSASDLNDIHTLGFRGEALPSIASVSRMTILTSDGEEAWKMVLTGGRLDDMSPAARTRGTTITVENLFFNQPARRRFLRTESTELSWIEKIVTGSSLSALNCSILLKHSGRTVFDLPVADSLPSRLRCRYHLSATDRCVEAFGKSGSTEVKLTVFPDRRWANRRHQFIIVNGRPVTAPAAYRPLQEAFSGPAGDPLIVCRITVASDLVDVNAHPAKREVRFRKPHELEAAVRSATLGIVQNRKESTSFAVSGSPHVSYTGQSEAGVEYTAGEKSLPASGSARVSYTGYSDSGYRPEKKTVSPSLFQKAFEIQAPLDEPSRKEVAASVNSGWGDTVEIMIVADSWLVTQTATGLLVVDQHAAHERILYERILDSLKGAMAAGQQRMLLPEEISLDQQDKALLKLYGAMIKQAGYDYTIAGDRLLLSSVPVGIKRGGEALLEVMESLASGSEKNVSEAENIAASSACKGAIKFGDKLSQAEARNLFHTLFNMKDPFHCPHGRPTMIELSFAELENRFGR
ncbi:hypothetical protein CSA37_12700 [Candidatus Fermentibacteria bacterium]|nr:MAG: hypothetical protein CSA37_12700 [Candidatus Fermentibacteria bacterium]